MISSVSGISPYNNYLKSPSFKGYYEKGDVFGYVSPETNEKCKKIRGNYLCPNSLNEINCFLRSGRDNMLNDTEKEIITEVDNAFKKLPGLEKPETFYRGLYGCHLDPEILKAEKGDTIIPDKGYAQVGLDEFYARKYLPGASCKPVLFEINCKAGAKVSKSRHTGTGAEEGMMPRNAEYKVADKKQINIMQGWGQYAEEVPVTVFTLDYRG